MSRTSRNLTGEVPKLALLSHTLHSPGSPGGSPRHKPSYRPQSAARGSPGRAGSPGLGGAGAAATPQKMLPRSPTALGARMGGGPPRLPLPRSGGSCCCCCCCRRGRCRGICPSAQTSRGLRPVTRAQAEHAAESSVGHTRQPTPSPYLGLDRRGRLHTRQPPARTGRGSREGPGRRGVCPSFPC